MSFGVFESVVTSEAEVGLARQASVDKLNAAVYDVREKLGSVLFSATSLEDFRDRVAMMKNDQSLFKVIEAAGLHPSTGVVRRIAGKNSILENEFKRQAAGGMVPDVQMQGSGATTGVPPASLGPTTGVQSGDAGGPGSALDDNGRQTPNQFTSRRRRAEITDDKGGFTGPQDIDSTFSHTEQGKELKPKDDWEGYRNSVDQDAPSKVQRNFASKLDWNVYLAWCQSNNRSAARLSSLNAYAANLSDSQYLLLANTLQACNDDSDWGSDHHPKVPSTKLKGTDKVARGKHRIDFDNDPDRPYAVDPYSGSNQINDISPEGHWEGPPPAPPGSNKHHALRRYVAWCDHHGYSKVARSTIDYYVSRVAGAHDMDPDLQGAYDMTWGGVDSATHATPEFAKSKVPGDKQLTMMRRKGPASGVGRHRAEAALRRHLYAQMATTIRWARTQHVACWPGCHENEAHAKKFHNKESRRRTAAPDYLQKADDALTQLLNQKAEEFQETIQPLQQALQTVQQAEQLQAQQNPLNVMPPAGTVNVMPGGGQPSTADQVGMPDPNQPDTSGLAQMLAQGAGAGTAPNDAPMGGGQDSPPPAAAGQGALPPDQSQQMMARRRRRSRQAAGVGEKFDRWRQQKTQQGDVLRGGDVDYDQFANEVGGIGERALNKLKQRNQTPDFAPINRPELQVKARRKKAAPGGVHPGQLSDTWSAGSGDGPTPQYIDSLRQQWPYLNQHHPDDIAAYSQHVQLSPASEAGFNNQPHFENFVAQGKGQQAVAQDREFQKNNVWDTSGGGGGGWVPRGEKGKWVDNGGYGQRWVPDKPRKTRGASHVRRAYYDDDYEPGGTSDDFHDYNSGHAHEQQDRSQQNGWKLTHADDEGNASWSHPSGHSVTGRDGPNGGSWQLHGPKGPMGHPHRSPEDAQRSMPKQAKRKRGGQGKVRGAARPRQGLRKGAPFASYEEGSRKQAWSGWGPAVFPKTRKVAGWEWDERLSGYLANRPERFACDCGESFGTPSGFRVCGSCGKQWNSYVIGTGGNNREAAAEKFIVREIPLRDNVIVASARGRSTVSTTHGAVDLIDPRTGNLHRLIDPGELDEGEDPGHPTFRKPPSDWARRGDGAKWTKSPIGR